MVTPPVVDGLSLRRGHLGDIQRQGVYNLFIVGVKVPGTKVTFPTSTFCLLAQAPIQHQDLGR